MQNSIVIGMDTNEVPIPKNSRLIKTDKPRPHICNICTRGFVRMEHLKRHKRSHTREKPFMCIFCGRCFSRKDLVVRHQGNVHKDLVNKNGVATLNSKNIVTNININNENLSFDNPGTNNFVKPKITNNDPNNNFVKQSNDNSNGRKKNKSIRIVPPTTANSLIDKKNANVVIINGNKDTIISKDIIDNISNNIINNNNNEFILPQASYKRRRFSFSAANSHSYTTTKTNSNNTKKITATNASNDVNMNDSTNKTILDTNLPINPPLTSPNDLLDDAVPNDVGFSTPQLNSKQLFNKINDMSFLDLENLLLPAPTIADNIDDKLLHSNQWGGFVHEDVKLPDSINDTLNGVSDLIGPTLNDDNTNALSSQNYVTASNKNLTNPDAVPANYLPQLDNSIDLAGKTTIDPSNDVKNKLAYDTSRTKSHPITMQENSTVEDSHHNITDTKYSMNSRNLSSNFLLLSNLPSFTDMLTMAPKTKASLERRQFSKILLTSNNTVNNTAHGPLNKATNINTDNAKLSHDTKNNIDHTYSNSEITRKKNRNVMLNPYQNIDSQIAEFPPPQPLLRKNSTLSTFGRNNNKPYTNNNSNNGMECITGNIIPDKNNVNAKEQSFFSNKNSLITPSSLLNTLGPQQHSSSNKNFSNIMDNINNYNVNSMDYQTVSSQWIEKFVANHGTAVNDNHFASNGQHVNHNNADHYRIPSPADNNNFNNFKVKTSNINDIGFWPSTSPSASSRSSVVSNDLTNNGNVENNIDNYDNEALGIYSSTSYTHHPEYANHSIDISPTANKITKKKIKVHKQPNNISNFLTSRQVDIHKMRIKEKRKLFGENDDEESSESDGEAGIEINVKKRNPSQNSSTTGSFKGEYNNPTHSTVQMNLEEQMKSIPPPFEGTRNHVSPGIDLKTASTINSHSTNSDGNTTEQRQYSKDPSSFIISTTLGFRYSNYSFYDTNLRDFIIRDNCLNDEYFPSLHQLNNYINLFEFEFARFIPFIHVPSIVPSEENYPLLISMAMVGALYDFHSSHSKLLFMISNLQVKKKLISLDHNSDDTTLWIIQSMILQAFFGIFNNDSKIMKNMNTHLMTLIQLIKRYNYHLPYETTMQPPAPKCNLGLLDEPVDKKEFIMRQLDNQEQILKNYHYFLMAQQRIRICHAALLISNFFASLVGLQCFLHSVDIRCGVPTPHDDLFNAKDANAWHEILKAKKIVIDSKFSLIFLANGGIPFENCLIFLTKGDRFFLENFKISKLTLLSLVVSIHERITLERINIIARVEKALSENIEITRDQIEMDWKLNALPQIDVLMTNWEMLYLKNGGILDINKSTIPLIDGNPVARLVLPLYLFAKIRRGHDLTYVMNRIWLKDWKMMNKTLDDLSYNWYTLQETTEWCIYILDSWINIVTLIIQRGKNGGGYHTPITTITIMFVCISVISEYLFKLESMAKNNDILLLDNKVKMIFFSIIVTLRKIQNTLIPEGNTMQSYLEFLQLQTHRYVSTLDDLDDLEEIKFATSEDADIYQFSQLIQKLCLSSRSLYLGVRILGDVPIWPISVVFAQALQKRAIFKVSQDEL